MPAGDAAAYIFQEGDELMRLALSAVVGMEREPHIGPICTYFLIEGDTVAVRPDPALLGVLASGKRQITRASQVLVFADNRVKESRHYFDMLSFLQQIGAIPLPTGASAG